MIKHYACCHTVCHIQKFYHEYLDWNKNLKVIETNLFMFKYQKLGNNIKDENFQI